MKTLKICYRVLLIILLTGNCVFAQDHTFNISGIVTDSASGQPLDHASVYLSNTTIGTYSLADGSFSLNEIPRGKYNLIVSYIGYQSKAVVIDENMDNRHFNVVLHTAVTRLKSIVIRGGVQNKEYLHIFERYFIGADDNASDCKILNTSVLYFRVDSASGVFTAEATEPLVIRNRALGYMIYYDLQAFRLDKNDNRLTYFGYPKFEEMDKGGERRQKKRENNRIETYLGSMRHFMQSLIAHQLKEQGFKVNKLSIIHDPVMDRDYSVLSPEEVPYDSMIVNAPEKPGYTKLKFTNSLYIIPFYYKTPELNHFFKWKRDAPLSEMAITESINDFMTEKKQRFTPCVLTMAVSETYIDPNGVLTNPLAVTQQGGWTQQRVADLLPLDYKMPVSK